MSFFHAMKWSFLAEMASKAVTPIVFIVLARLLTPKDFGVVSAAVMVIAFCQIFWEAGMGKALIQRQTNLEDAANVAFWVNLGLGIVIASLLFWGAQPIALSFFQDDRVTVVLQVMTLQILLGALASVHTALLQKEMGFKKLFWVRLSTIALPGVVSILLAWNGLGYWALLAGTLMGQALQVAMLWRFSGWRPERRFNFLVAKEMGGFGIWVGVTGLLSWFYIWVDSLVVGKFFDTSTLGLYRIGNQLSDIVFILLFSPLVPVLYSYLACVQHDSARFRLVTESSIATISWLSFPIGIFVFHFSSSIETIFFNSKWLGVSTVIAFLSIRQSFAWISSLNGEAYRAMGKPRYETIILTLFLPVYLLVYLVTVRIGLLAFLYGRLILVVLSMTLHMWLLSRLLRLSAYELFRRILLAGFFGLLVVAFAKFVATRMTGNDLAQISIAIVISAPILLTCFCVFERSGALRFLVENSPLRERLSWARNLLWYQ
jgi:O-antigen/teichoic acid export membrane protein